MEAELTFLLQPIYQSEIVCEMLQPPAVDEAVVASVGRVGNKTLLWADVEEAGDDGSLVALCPRRC